MQSNRDSIFETILSVGTGFFIALLLNLYMLPIFVDDITNQVMSSAIIIGVIYTSVSMARAYVFRRVFNKFAENYNKNLIE